MIDKFASVLILSLLFISCNSSLKEPIEITIDQSTLTECATAACPEVLVEYIQYEIDAKKTRALNDSINNFIINSLNLGDPAAAAIATNPNEAIQYFIKDYWRDTSEFPEINEYEAEVIVVENFRSDDLISIEMSQYSYTGGAHGYNSVSFLNVDSKTGEVITNNQFIKDKNALTVLAENKLRENYNLSKTDNINAGVFWFENDTFYLSNAIGISNGNLVIHYNSYEIASYADGSIDIELPLEEAAPFLNYSVKN
ncbi:DUF3298 and DUF4163 domain-containing protein [Patiriisocius marinus]|uniref:DUF3298 and DUF4163 domain-containing protein n=1 Tax=Patiriisocius marinus TaxID=1397112 RepID=UPI00232ECA98|nr:DUF3298 and DUF4163 domain-containing protein [Patiriisocius marinus]